MPIVPRVGRKKASVIGFLGGSYLLLTLGGLTMVIPFMIMLTGAVSNGWDYERHSPAPLYLLDRSERYMKYVAERYLSVTREFPRDWRLFSAAYQPPARWTSFRAIREDPAYGDRPPLMFGSEAGREKQLARLRADYEEWLGTLDPLMTLPMFARFTIPQYQEFIREKYERRYLQSSGKRRDEMSARELERGALDVMADRWQEARFTSFFYLGMMTEASLPYHLREWLPPLDERRFQDYLQFVKSLPADRKMPITARHLWVRYLESVAGDLAAFNEATGLDVDAYTRLDLPEREPDNPRLRELWREFTHEKWPLWMIELPDSMREEWLGYLRRRFASVAAYNRFIEGEYASWNDVHWDGGAPENALERNVWRDFLLSREPEVPAEHRVYPERSWRAFLRERYETTEALNAAYGWNLARLDEAQVPIAEVDYAQFLANEREFVRSSLTFNFARVFSYMAIQGRAVFNTFVLVLLSIAATLTVNPLAAYALSRFRLRTTHQILIFLLATMAFPAEVSMIPNFLLLRELGLLNTFAALVLPGLASGFSIFLLKGFFDSLPGELFEAATIDGASELTIFGRIVLPMTKPIMAYMALLSFMAAYGGFIWAFLVCQNEKMWTLMVWMYQYQQTAAEFPYMVMAAFVLASIPTLLVFIFCQNIILRGIIVPQMK